MARPIRAQTGPQTITYPNTKELFGVLEWIVPLFMRFGSYTVALTMASWTLLLPVLSLSKFLANVSY